MKTSTLLIHVCIYVKNYYFILINWQNRLECFWLETTNLVAMMPSSLLALVCVDIFLVVSQQTNRLVPLYLSTVVRKALSYFTLV